MAVETEATHAYRHLRELIIRTELRPGSALVESDLMRRLDVGRTPLRDALRKLDDEGLVEILPRRGTFVTQVTLHDLQQIFEVRSGLEDIVAGLAVERCTVDDLEIMRGMTERLNGNGAADASDVALDGELHAFLLRVARNRLLEDLYRRVADASLRLLYLTNCGMEDRVEQRATFQAVHTALACHDAEALAETLRDHVRAFRDRVGRSIFSTADAMMT